MATKTGRNDPCPCGSGKKYKQCHEPIDRAQADHARLLRRAQDRLLAKLIESTQHETMVAQLPAALERYWQNQYSPADLPDLDEREDRGADRFLTWLAFDATDESGTTLVERIAAAPPAELELDQYEAELLQGWTATRLRPYLVTEIVKGKGATVRDLISDHEVTLRDHAAAKRLEQDDVIFAHLVPVGAEYYIAGAAAHTTADTRDKLAEYLANQREVWDLQHPDDDDEAFVRANSHLLNHFVMALPRETEEPTRLDDLVLQGRTALLMARTAVGLGPDDDDDDDDDVAETPAAPADDPEAATDASS